MGEENDDQVPAIVSPGHFQIQLQLLAEGVQANAQICRRLLQVAHVHDDTPDSAARLKFTGAVRPGRTATGYESKNHEIKRILPQPPVECQSGNVNQSRLFELLRQKKARVHKLDPGLRNACSRLGDAENGLAGPCQASPRGNNRSVRHFRGGQERRSGCTVGDSKDRVTIAHLPETPTELAVFPNRRRAGGGDWGAA